MKLTDKVCLIHCPMSNKKFDKLYTVKYLGNVVEGQIITYLNVSIDEMKKFSIKSIKAEEAVWFGCDVGKKFHRDLGVMDNDLTNGRKGNDKLAKLLEELREVADETNKQNSKKLKINQSAAITCVKPSGTVSQLVDAASGIHPRHSDFYVRTVRADNKDPLCQFMKDKGFPHEA